MSSNRAFSNNQVLVDKLLNEEFAAQEEYSDTGSFFELLAASKLMASYGLDDEEIASGVIGGSRDGGCDAVYAFCNDLLLREDSELSNIIKRKSDIEILIIQTKKTKTFGEDVFLKWQGICRDLLAFDRSPQDYADKYSESVIEAFSLIRDVVEKSARKGATTLLRFVDVANANQVSQAVRRQADDLIQLAKDVVGAGSFECAVDFVGADELMSMWYPPDEDELLMRFTSAYSGVEKRGDFIGLVTLEDFFAFLKTPSNQLRGYLFEDNIRDYEGKVEVNKSIRATLEESKGEDFWWLNNGVTIIASSTLQATGGEVRLTEPRIVNGLQTSYEIFSYMSNRRDDSADGRRVMVRIIVPESDETRNRVIMATNSQTRVKKTSLRATDPIHSQIEIYMRSNDLYYERRKNHYRNQGKKQDEIVTISFLAQCLMSIILLSPDQARARPSTLLSDNKNYKKLFPKNGNLEAFWKAALLGKEVFRRLPKVLPDLTRSETTDLKFYILTGVAVRLARKQTIEFADIVDMNIDSVTDSVIREVAEIALEEYRDNGGTSAVAKSGGMTKGLLEKVLALPN